MNPFEEFLRRLFGSGPPPTVMEEERQAKNLGKTAENMPKMAKQLGKAFLDAYKARNEALMQAASQQVLPGTSVPLSDFGGAPQNMAQRDLALDVMSAGLGSGMRVGSDLLSSAPSVGATTIARAIPEWLTSSIDYGNKKTALREQLLDSFRRSRHPLEGQVPSRRIYHSSGGIFEAPTLDPTRQGAGVGDYWQGTGAAYVSESPAVRDYYRKVLARRTPNDVKLPSGKVVGNPLDKLLAKQDKLIHELDDAYINGIELSPAQIKEIRSKISGLDKRIDAWRGMKPEEYTASLPSFLDELKREYLKLSSSLNDPERSRRQDIVQLRGLRDQINRLEEKLARPTLVNPKEPRVTSYSGFFYANPNELFNLNIPIAQQPAAERIIAGLNELPVGSGDRGFILPGERVGDALIRQQRNNIAEPNLSSTNANEMIVSGQRQRGSNWSAVRPEFTSATPWQVMEALKDKEIVGNQYLTRNDFESILAGDPVANPSYNYVVIDPSRLRFVDLFGSANPFGPLGTTMQAIQNEQEKKNAAKSRKKP